MKRILSIIICIVLCFLMVACGDDNNIVGTWLGEGQAQALGDIEEDGDLVYVFSKDGKCEIKCVFEENPELCTSDSYEYTVEDDKIIITSGEKVIEFTYAIDEYVMKMTSRGVTSEFKKID